MKALSLWQPWASAMEIGDKRNETRGWYMSYRGDLVICAAKRKPTLADAGGDKELLRKALRLPLGVALCVVEVYDCLPSAVFSKPIPGVGSFLLMGVKYQRDSAGVTTTVLSESESVLGNYAPGRWITMTRNLRRLKTPVPVIGRQGLFNLPPDVEAKVREQI